VVKIMRKCLNMVSINTHECSVVVARLINFLSKKYAFQFSLKNMPIFLIHEYWSLTLRACGDCARRIVILSSDITVRAKESLLALHALSARDSPGAVA
jgi:hypothetical protein